jgi:hypothetical protein
LDSWRQFELGSWTHFGIGRPAVKLINGVKMLL